MGLCKCPKRKVTNIFCYEHRVNVCEYCLMQNHPKCPIDSYRNWLTDSEYSTKCGLCDDELVNSETVRLLCFHIVHWGCLDSWARSLPLTTAPAGYNCPICKKMCLFPTLNQISPIADALRKKMQDVNWARTGLGLSLLDVENKPSKEPIFNGYQNGENQTGDPSSFIKEQEGVFNSPSINSQFENSATSQSHSNQVSPYSSSNNSTNPYTKLHQSYGGINNSFSYNERPSPTTGTTTAIESNTSARKSVKFDMDTPLLIDEDDHKYRRRSPIESLSRWIRTFIPVGKRRTSSRRTACYFILIIVVIILLFMFVFGRNDSGDDEFFQNPNIRLGDKDKLHNKHVLDSEN